ncbi:MlaD family protein [sulfur-oxidizing endosymbiont of Gigantopelta aegis]|uniref:MlaD family protein n=1 Tax=sulfur-oxidizing endosymbiont of Gigantopelta aegis TaxID=2794934 RepID=UPI0018DC2835|nr:MlaD family protein [sulfur-oxidizing endosymbiont of Gigantopelta aegis]
MSIKANPSVVGGFVIGAIILVVVSFLVLGSGRLLKNDMRLMAVFPGTVNGLHVGSPVLFRGVNIGSVVKIELYHNHKTQQSLVPVYLDLKQEVMELMIQGDDASSLTEEQALKLMVDLIKQGLHARLTLESLVSGRQNVEFEFDPTLPIKLTGIDKKYLEIPTSESDFNKLQNLFKSIPLKELTDGLIVTVTELNKMFASKDSREIFNNINATIIGSRKFIDNLNEQVVPLSQSTQQRLAEVQVLLQNTEQQLTKTLLELTSLSMNVNEKLTNLTESATTAFDKSEVVLDNMNAIVDKKSTTRTELERSLKELSRAAKSMRVFTEYLERHPEAIIQGKKY